MWVLGGDPDDGVMEVDFLGHKALLLGPPQGTLAGDCVGPTAYVGQAYPNSFHRFQGSADTTILERGRSTMGELTVIPEDKEISGSNRKARKDLRSQKRSEDNHERNRMRD